MIRKFFCFDLYTTGLLIGWLGLAESITSCITSILMLENIDTSIIPNITNGTDNKEIRSLTINLLGTNIALNIIDLLASGLLIAGTIKRNRLLILPWLINSTISLLFALVWMILASVYISQNFNDYSTFIPIIVMAFIVYVIYLYAFVAIYSLYQYVRRSSPNNEYSSLIEDRNATGYPIYTRC